jgi:hypothetical protein
MPFSRHTLPALSDKGLPRRHARHNPATSERDIGGAMKTRRWLFIGALGAAAAAGCGGDGGGAPPPPPPAPAPAPAPVVLPPLLTDTSVLLSAASPYSANCSGVVAGTIYINAEVEPYIAVNPRDPMNIVAVWQQDRWSEGGASGVMSATTLDGGVAWTRTSVPFSRCGGGNAGNGGDYQRATDPWVTFAPDGTAFQMALAATGASFTPGSASAMLVSRSTDGGRTWSNPSTLIRDGAQFFNDKNTITADPNDARYVYAVWDRLDTGNRGPSVFTRTTDGGLTWEGVRVIYDPGVNSQTIGNVIAVLPNGIVVNLFTRLDTNASNQMVGSLHVVRSLDQGATWSGPFRIADLLSVGARDPENGTPIRDGAILPQIAAGPAGELWVVWQDARFSNGAVDGIALSRSTDGGQTWSAPVQVNSAPTVHAFTPSVRVRADGMLGVLYFDLRSNTADVTTLPTELILARSTNAVTWTEQRVAPGFDMATAPFARGLFIGDYMALELSGNAFVPIYVRTNAGDLANRTDVYAVVARSAAATSAGAEATARAARAAPVAEPDAEFRQRVHDNIVRVMERRLPGWADRFAPR